MRCKTQIQEQKMQQQRNEKGAPYSQESIRYQSPAGGSPVSRRGLRADSDSTDWSVGVRQ